MSTGRIVGMPRSMILSLVLLLMGTLTIGCQVKGGESGDKPQSNVSPEKSTAPSPSEEAGAEAGTIKPGMDMAEVKKLKGVPKETKHEHGSGGSEIDIWVYEGQTVTFTDGKVSE